MDTKFSTKLSFNSNSNSKLQSSQKPKKRKMILDYISLIFKDIKGRKFSSFLTFFAISLGILTIFVIVLVSQGFQQSIQKQFEQMGSNRLIIQASGGNAFAKTFKNGLTENEAKLLENKPYLKDVQPMTIRKTNIKYGSETVTRTIVGVPFTKEFFTDYNIEVEQGRYPKNSDKFGIILGSSSATDIFKKDISVGSNVYIKDMKFKVLGILKSIGNPEDDKTFYISNDDLQNIFDSGDKIDMIYATVQEGYSVDLASDNVKTLLENKLGKDTIKVQTFGQLLKQVTDILSIVQATLGGIALVSLVVGAVGIINTMFVIVTEKTKDIGVMKAIGAKNSDIFLIYMIQAGIFGFLGAILGVLGGSIGGLVFGKWAIANGYSFLEITINPGIVISLLIFGFAIGLLSGFVPAYRASRLLIVDTFRR